MLTLVDMLTVQVSWFDPKKHLKLEYLLWLDFASFDASGDCGGPMAFSVTSARDPIFYRFISFLSDSCTHGVR